MHTHYRNLSRDERGTIMFLLMAGNKPSEVATLLGRNRDAGLVSTLLSARPPARSNMPFRGNHKSAFDLSPIFLQNSRQDPDCNCRSFIGQPEQDYAAVWIASLEDPRSEALVTGYKNAVLGMSQGQDIGISQPGRSFRDPTRVLAMLR